MYTYQIDVLVFVLQGVGEAFQELVGFLLLRLAVGVFQLQSHFAYV